MPQIRAFSPVVPKREGTDTWLYNCLRGLQEQSASLRKTVGQPPVVGDYWFKPGLAGGQLGYGGINSGENATIASTANATKGFIYLGTNFSVCVDETNKRVGLDYSTPVGVLDIAQEIPTAVTTSFPPASDAGVSGLYVNSGGLPGGTNYYPYLGGSTPDDSTNVHNSGATTFLNFNTSVGVYITNVTPVPSPGIHKVVASVRLKWTIGTGRGSGLTYTVTFTDHTGAIVYATYNTPDITIDAAGVYVTYSYTFSAAEVYALQALGWTSMGFFLSPNSTSGCNGTVSLSWVNISVTSTTATNLTNWYNQTRTLFSSVSSDGYLGIGTGASLPIGMLTIFSDHPGAVPIFLKGNPGQSGNYLEVRNNGGTLLGGINNSGQYFDGGGAPGVFIAPNATATKKFLTEVSSTPSWLVLAAADLPGYVAVNSTNQSADIGTTNFTGASAAGMYRVRYYLETTTADGTAGAVTLQINYGDDIGATNQTSAALNLAATTTRVSGSFTFYQGSGTVNYQTTHTGTYGTIPAKYALRMRLEYLG